METAGLMSQALQGNFADRIFDSGTRGRQFLDQIVTFVARAVGFEEMDRQIAMTASAKSQDESEATRIHWFLNQIPMAMHPKAGFFRRKKKRIGNCS
jgi:hypothetical protein